MQSPYGQRGAICAHFGWTWSELHHNISWATLNRIMVDLPSYDADSDYGRSNPERAKLGDITADNVDSIVNQINSMI